ncbi:MAG: hypothetical protein LUF86_01940, partial [Clostridiales bacterium]|nr:hypothetical protein [Clostridiales bacterium]
MVVQSIIVMFGSFAILLFAGVPISAGIGIASIATAFAAGMDPAVFALTAAQRCFSGLDSFSLLTLPVFSLVVKRRNKVSIGCLVISLC